LAPSAAGTSALPTAGCFGWFLGVDRSQAAAGRKEGGKKDRNNSLIHFYLDYMPGPRGVNLVTRFLEEVAAGAVKVIKVLEQPAAANLSFNKEEEIFGEK
jgi:hypothetical protein